MSSRCRCGWRAPDVAVTIEGAGKDEVTCAITIKCPECGARLGQGKPSFVHEGPSPDFRGGAQS